MASIAYFYHPIHRIFAAFAAEQKPRMPIVLKTYFLSAAFFNLLINRHLALSRQH